MMKGLVVAIEPTDPPGSIALGRGGTIIHHRELDQGRQLSETFLPLLHSLLKDEGSDVTDITGVVITSGPGSFTGIRVGFSFAYGIAHACGVPIYPFPTLDVMAYCSPGRYDMIVPTLDARKKEVYTAMYRRVASKVVRESDYISIAPENLVYKMVFHNSFVFGPGYLRYREIFNESGIGPFTGEEGYFHILHAKALLEYFYSQNEIKGVRPEEARPIYVRPSEAERKIQEEGDMTGKEKGIIDLLVKEDEEFKKLVDEHRELDRQIQELDSRVYLLPEEKIERKKLSKMKLSKKDKIAKIVSDYKKKTT